MRTCVGACLVAALLLIPRTTPAEDTLATRVGRMGGRGSEPGRFQRPVSVSFDAFGHLFVADRGNHRVQEFDPDYKFVRERGGFGFDPGRFVDPRSVVADHGARVYILDTTGGRVQTLDARREPESVLLDSGGAGHLGPHRPVALAVDATGKLYLSDREMQAVWLCSPTGDSLAMWGGFGTGPGQFRKISGLCPDEHGGLFVLDSGAGKVVHLDSGGAFVEDFAASPGRAEGSRPEGIALSGDGRLAVADPGLKRIVILSTGGRLLSTLGEADSTAAFQSPVAVAWSGRRLAVADEGAHEVTVFLMPPPPAARGGD